MQRWGRQLSPKHGVLALRAACPVDGCGLVEKHGLRNAYTELTITFQCSEHGKHAMRVSEPAEAARLEANAPTRNLIRGIAHLLDSKGAQHPRHGRQLRRDLPGDFPVPSASGVVEGDEPSGREDATCLVCARHRGLERREAVQESVRSRGRVRRHEAAWHR